MKYKQPRTLAQLKADPRVADVSYESGGDVAEWSYWVSLKDGWQVKDDPQNHTIHEDSIKEVLARFRPIPCDCCEACRIGRSNFACALAEAK